MMCSTSRTVRPPGSRCETPGAKAGLDGVEVERQVDRPVEPKRGAVPPGAHVEHLDPEPLRLLALVPVIVRMPTWTSRSARPLLQDARERAGVREAVALELVVEVGVGVEVQDGEPGDARAARARRTGKVTEWSPPRAIGRPPASRVERLPSFDPRRDSSPVAVGRSRSPASASAP